MDDVADDWTDHPAHLGCYLRVLQEEWGAICVLCYYHVQMYSVVTVRTSRTLDLVVCQACGAALHARGRFEAGIVCRMYDVLVRRLQFDMEAARMQQEIDDYIPGEEVVH